MLDNNEIIVRKTRLNHPDDLHKYNIYIPYQDKYINVFTCMCCKKVFTELTSVIDEPDEGLTLKDIPKELLQHWSVNLKNNEIVSNILKNILK